MSLSPQEKFSVSALVLESLLTTQAELRGMSRPLLKLGGGSVEILRDVRH